MTKKDLAEEIHSRIGLSKRESSEIVDFFFELAKDKLSSGEAIKLPRFGSFKIQQRKARKGRNPSTGETIRIPSRKAIVFRPSRFLRDAINESSDNE